MVVLAGNCRSTVTADCRMYGARSAALTSWITCVDWKPASVAGDGTLGKKSGSPGALRRVGRFPSTCQSGESADPSLRAVSETLRQIRPDGRCGSGLPERFRYGDLKEAVWHSAVMGF